MWYFVTGAITGGIGALIGWHNAMLYVREHYDVKPKS